eukprot:2943063-Prymnesium_polylepis.2
MVRMLGRRQWCRRHRWCNSNQVCAAEHCHRLHLWNALIVGDGGSACRRGKVSEEIQLLIWMVWVGHCPCAFYAGPDTHSVQVVATAVGDLAELVDRAQSSMRVVAAPLCLVPVSVQAHARMLCIWKSVIAGIGGQRDTFRGHHRDHGPP